MRVEIRVSEGWDDGNGTLGGPKAYSFTFKRFKPFN
jgi:hypothetical protein